MSDNTMREIVLDGPGPAESLAARRLPIPEPRAGWVLIRVRAFGMNRSELQARLGLADGVTFPRVLSIKAVGEVVACPGGEFPVATRVAALMGGMSRQFDGGYAEYTCVPATNVLPSTATCPGTCSAPCPRCCRASRPALSRPLSSSLSATWHASRTRVGKPLERELAGLFGARRGPYRLPYRIDDEAQRVYIVHIDHRADVYRSR
jgi:mRNA-degrading endonuclease RelE of RelBE toxin-antitoxin system